MKIIANDTEFSPIVRSEEFDVLEREIRLSVILRFKELDEFGKACALISNELG